MAWIRRFKASKPRPMPACAEAQAGMRPATALHSAEGRSEAEGATTELPSFLRRKKPVRFTGSSAPWPQSAVL